MGKGQPRHLYVGSVTCALVLAGLCLSNMPFLQLPGVQNGEQSSTVNKIAVSFLRSCKEDSTL